MIGPIAITSTACGKAETDAKRGRRLLQGAIYVSLVAIIIGLVGWINQSFIVDKWRFLTVSWPYERTNFRPYVLSTAKERVLKPGDAFRECAKDCPEMVVVPGGEYMMGSPRFRNEGPQHKVTIANPFAVSKFDVTFSDWDACVSVDGCPRVTDSGMGRDRKPVINVTWDDAQWYVAWLSEDDRAALPSAQRGRMGIRGPRRQHNGLILGRCNRQGQRQLQRMRQSVG